MEKTMYYAIIGDIVNSKKEDNRKELQNKLNRLLNRINETYDESLASNFLITLGDEFQGLLSDGRYLMEIIGEIEAEMHPVKFRIGIGHGNLSTHVDKLQALGSDGPAYYHARAAINFLEDNETRKARTYKNKWIIMENENVNSSLVSLINSLLTVQSNLENSWTKAQRETVIDMMELENQFLVAEKRGLNQSTISRSIQSSQYYLYTENLKTLNDVFSKEVIDS